MEFIKRSYHLDMDTREQLYGEYPKYLEWDGQKAGMDHMDNIIHNLNGIITTLLIKTDNKEMDGEQALNHLGDLQYILENIHINLAWHSDGESTWDNKYLMEAFLQRDGKQDNLKELEQLLNTLNKD